MAKSNSPKHTGNGINQPPVHEKTVVKKKSGCFPALLLLIAVTALIIWLLSHFNIGFFGKDSNGKINSSDSISSDELTAPDKSDKNNPASDDGSEKIIDVSVNGNEYWYDNGKIELDDFISNIKDMNGIVSVHITDNNAYSDVMQKLIDALKKENIPYSEKSGE